MAARALLPRRSIIALSAVLLCGSASHVPAGAATVAATGPEVVATVAAWGASAVPRGAPAAAAPLTLSWTLAGTGATSYFEVVNVGTVALRSQALVVTVTVTHGGGTLDPIAFDACVGAAWDVAVGSCPGTVQPLGSSGGPALATGIALTPGHRLSVRASTTPQTAARTTTFLDVLVARPDVRAPTTTSG